MNLENCSGFETDRHLKQNIFPVANRVLSVVKEFGTEQNKCSKIDSCDYVGEGIKKLQFNFSQSNGYITLVCEKYPLACELNSEILEEIRKAL